MADALHRRAVPRAILVAAMAGLAGSSIAAAAPVGGLGPAAEKRYRACMESLAANAPKALDDARAWVKAGGGDPARHCAAAAEMAIGRFSEAGETLADLAEHGGAEIAGNPGLRASLWGQAAHAFLAADQPQRAEAAAAAGSTLVPRDAGLLVLHARALAAQDRYADAIVDLDRAIALDPNLTEAYVFRGSALRQRRALDPALADLDKALTLDPDQPEALLERGIVRWLKGDAGGAAADWRKLVESAPKSAAAESARLNLERMAKMEKPPKGG
ncbi:MAG: tetratricopeptide repeat protein [Rhodospirillales bacterium]